MHNLNTPPTGLNADDSGWPRADDFRFAIDAFFYEVKEYITERKWAIKQIEFDFENEEDPFANAGIPEDVTDITEADNAKTQAEQVA